MEANYYKEVTGTLSGTSVTFNGNVLSNTLTSGILQSYSFEILLPTIPRILNTTAALAPGAFSVSLDTINDPARHVQYGFQVVGPDVWITDVGSIRKRSNR